MFNRRSFLKTGLAALPLASISDISVQGSAEPTHALIDPVLPGKLFASDTAEPWQQTVRRVGQLNMTEHDPVTLNVEEWADYWSSLKVDVVFISVTGILAFYPTQVPIHRKAKFLGDRDFFGDCCNAAKDRKLRDCRLGGLRCCGRGEGLNLRELARV